MTPKREARREQIFNVGAQLFARKGYGRASLQELAELLGVTKPAIYYYYASKDELLFAMTSWVMDRVLSDVAEIRMSALEPSGKLKELIRRYIVFFASHPAELTIMSTEVESLKADHRSVIEERQRQYVSQVREIVSCVLAQRPGETPNETSAVFALLGGMNWIFKWYDPKGMIVPEQLAEDFNRIFAVGLAGGGIKKEEGK